jgi:hypothetical protein
MVLTKSFSDILENRHFPMIMPVNPVGLWKKGEAWAMETGAFYMYRYHHMSKERWDGIVQCKRDFIANKIKNLVESPYLTPEVAKSWIRCRQAGLNPYKFKLGKSLDPKVIEQSKKANQSLIEVLTPLFYNFQLPEELLTE